MAHAPEEKKTALVTGSTDGIGQNTAIRLAHAGYRVCVHGRDPKRVAASVERVQGHASSPNDIVSVCADLSTLDGMKKMCQDVAKVFPEGLDVLVNNAGVFEESKRVTPDGLELTFAINVMAPYVVTKLLLPLLRKRERPRIVNASSMSQAYSIDFDNLQFERGYSAHASYSLSKLCVAMFSAELASRIPASEIVINSLDPGTVSTKMLAAGWGMGGIPVSRANDEFWLATAPEAEQYHARYFVGRRDSRPAPPVSDAEARKRLWRYLEEKSGIKY